jgi:heterodisulfide reductase subunit C/uncharacterized membrane protein YhaH (DUF805 family)
MIQQILFVIITVVAFYFAYRNYRIIWDNIQLGVPDPQKDNQAARWKDVILVALGQKKMFKNFLPAIFHSFIYVAFILAVIELIEIMLDGALGQHRMFAESLGSFYTFLINFVEILSLLAFVATIVFLWRRNVMKVERFHKAEMSGWPFLDANLILIGEILLIIGIFSMNSADTVLQQVDSAHYPDTGTLLLSGQLSGLIDGFNTAQLIAMERFGWWLHYLVVLGFLNYLPISKHLHILFAFFNVYFADRKGRGRMDNMPEIQKEVRIMMGLDEESTEPPSDDLPDFGAKDIFGLKKTTLLGAYTCTECGRCTSECPANQTGKLLSPRKIMMDIRDRMDEVRRNLKVSNPEHIAADKRGEGVKLSVENYDDGKSLFDYISREEIRACTTCNACVEACPVMIDPLDPILSLRRYEILTESTGPQDWMPMFTSLENSSSPWQVPQSRSAWVNELKS